MCPLCPEYVRNGSPGSAVQEHAVGLAAPARLVLPVAGDLGTVLPALHVPELARLLEAIAFLPGWADLLRAQGCFAVPEGAIVPLGARRVKVKVAVVILPVMVGSHHFCLVLPRAVRFPLRDNKSLLKFLHRLLPEGKESERVLPRRS